MYIGELQNALRVYIVEDAPLMCRCLQLIMLVSH